MARMARIVVPGLPHHLTQRGNRRQRTFFRDDDYRSYLALMKQWCMHYGVDVWAYCLMPNHTHLIAVPSTEDALRLAIGEAHRRYTREINFRKGWRGHLWQGRFASFPMDERYLLAAARYVERNPVRARIVERPEDYPWSSARAHLCGYDDPLVSAKPLLALVGDWRSFLDDDNREQDHKSIRQHERTGRPLGCDSFLTEIEQQTGRVVRKQRPGPKARCS